MCLYNVYKVSEYPMPKEKALVQIDIHLYALSFCRRKVKNSQVQNAVILSKNIFSVSNIFMQIFSVSPL